MWCVLVKQAPKNHRRYSYWDHAEIQDIVKKTRAGGVLKIVREHYLREDIWCGSEVCKECNDEAPVLQEDACIESNLCSYPHYLIPDTMWFYTRYVLLIYFLLIASYYNKRNCSEQL